MRFMAFDNEHHKVVVFETPNLTRRKSVMPESCGMHHIAFTYASFADLASTYLRLKDEGIVPWRTLNHGTSFALDYHDPDYNQCELQCSCFPLPEGEKHHLNDWLATGAFNRNPIGVMFDMDEAIKAFQDGCPVAEIVSPRALRVGDHSEAELRKGKMAPLDDAGRAPKGNKSRKQS